MTSLAENDHVCEVKSEALAGSGLKVRWRAVSTEHDFFVSLWGCQFPAARLSFLVLLYVLC